MTKSIDEITAQMNIFVGKLNQDLQISSSSRLLDVSPFHKATMALSGLASADLPSPLRNSFAQFAQEAIEQERILAEISTLTGAAVGEIKDFCQIHQCSLEFIQTATRAGAKLDKEDIKRTMEAKAIYSTGETLYAGGPFSEGLRALVSVFSQQHTFIVILPNNERREVKAAYMEVDGGSLYFEDEDHETILAFGAGHWVWAERVKEDEDA